MVEPDAPILVEGFYVGYIEKWKTFYQRALNGGNFGIEEQQELISIIMKT